MHPHAHINARAHAKLQHKRTLYIREFLFGALKNDVCQAAICAS